jgi:hypothetical protein
MAALRCLVGGLPVHGPGPIVTAVGTVLSIGVDLLLLNVVVMNGHDWLCCETELDVDGTGYGEDRVYAAAFY